MFSPSFSLSSLNPLEVADELGNTSRREPKFVVVKGRLRQIRPPVNRVVASGASAAEKVQPSKVGPIPVTLADQAFARALCEEKEQHYNREAREINHRMEDELKSRGFTVFASREEQESINKDFSKRLMKWHKQPKHQAGNLQKQLLLAQERAHQDFKQRVVQANVSNVLPLQYQAEPTMRSEIIVEHYAAPALPVFGPHRQGEENENPTLTQELDEEGTPIPVGVMLDNFGHRTIMVEMLPYTFPLLDFVGVWNDTTFSSSTTVRYALHHFGAHVDLGDKVTIFLPSTLVKELSSFVMGRSRDRETFELLQNKVRERLKRAVLSPNQYYLAVTFAPAIAYLESWADQQNMLRVVERAYWRIPIRESLSRSLETYKKMSRNQKLAVLIVLVGWLAVNLYKRSWWLRLIHTIRDGSLASFRRQCLDNARALIVYIRTFNG